MRNFPFFSCNEINIKGNNNLTLEEEMYNYISTSNKSCKIRRIRKMVYNGVDLNSNNFLTLALEQNISKKIINYLIDCGCDINSFDHRGDNILTLAIRMKRYDIIDILLKNKNININAVNYNNYSPLMIASMAGSEKMIIKLLHNGADINHQHCNGNTALHVAVKTNHYNIVKKLLEYNANVNIINIHNETPICFASNYNIIKLLLLYRANPNHTDKKSNTLLHRLVKYGSLNCIKLLIDYQANPLIENYNKLNVIEYARIQNKHHIVDILTKYSLHVKKQYNFMIIDILSKNNQDIYLHENIMNFLF